MKIEAMIIKANSLKLTLIGSQENNIRDIMCMKNPPYIKYPRVVVTLLYLLTIVVVVVINVTPNKTTKK